jgi:hypothetical protein
MKRLVARQAAAAAIVSSCALHLSVSSVLAKTCLNLGGPIVCNVLQDTIDEACAPSPYLRPCGTDITLEEINSRLQYELQAMKIEEEESKMAGAQLLTFLALLYAAPTQTTWDTSKALVLIPLSDSLRGRVSKMIDAYGALLLLGTNRDPKLVREKIRLYLLTNGWDNNRFQA